MKNFEVTYIKSISATKGNLISENDYKKRGYWMGNDEVRQINGVNYLCVFGSRNTGNAQSACYHVFEIINAPNGLDITNLELLYFPEIGEKYRVFDLCYMSIEEINEYMEII